MIDYVAMLREFHTKYGHYIADRPKIPAINHVILRRRLIAEEAKEFDYAASTGDLVEIADALADLLYVTVGSAIAFGIPIEEIFTEVHRSNMTKSTEMDEYGKTIKGPNFELPKIKEILDKYK